jgi:NADPH:quinone reductase-like Zn-dependent oxidoreductase
MISVDRLAVRTFITPFDRDGVAADYALVPVEVLAPKPGSLSHIQAAALPMPGLSAWQALIVHGRLQAGDRVGVTGAHGGVGHVAVQLARSRGAALVEEGEPCDLLFDTVGGQALARWAGLAGRIVTIAAEAPGARYFVVPSTRELCCSLISGAAGVEIWVEVLSGGARIPIFLDLELTTPRDMFARILVAGTRSIRGSPPM